METISHGNSRPLGVLDMHKVLFHIPCVYEPIFFPPQPKESRDDQHPFTEEETEAQRD